MSTPDEAAAVDHDRLQLCSITEADVGAVIEASAPFGFDQSRASTGVVILVGPDFIMIREPEKSFNTTLHFGSGVTYRVLEPAPSAEPAIAPVDTSMIRELISVSDRLKLADGEVKELKRRKAELSEKLVEQFAANGMDNLSLDGRTSYVHTATGAQFLDRPIEDGGGKYKAEDLVPVLRELGKPEYITPETTNWMTISSLLREYRDNEEPVPAKLAQMVRLAGSPEIRVKAPSKNRKT